MNTDDRTQSESTQPSDFNFEQAADAVNDSLKFVDLAKGIGAGVSVGGGVGAAAGGAGIMQGLAAVGGVVGGGAVAGIGVLGAAPAAAAKMVMNQVLADDDRLSPKERDARAVGRFATTVGVVAAPVATVGAIATAGSVAGLSGAGITTGLAAIGGTVGGGMTAGVAIAVAAPAVAVVGLGYGVYKFCQWLTSDLSD